MQRKDFDDFDDKPPWWERVSDYLALAGAGWLMLGVLLVIVLTLAGKFEGLFKMVSALAAGQ